MWQIFLKSVTVGLYYCTFWLIWESFAVYLITEVLFFLIVKNLTSDLSGDFGLGAS